VPDSLREGGPIIASHAGSLDGVSVPPHTVVLSFDDGPDPAWTPQVLEVLRRYQIRATFFLLGSQMLRYPALVRQEVAEGHEIGQPIAA